MAITAGLLVLRSKLNCILRPAFSNAVMGGIATKKMENRRKREREGADMITRRRRVSK